MYIFVLEDQFLQHLTTTLVGNFLQLMATCCMNFYVLLFSRAWNCDQSLALVDFLDSVILGAVRLAKNTLQLMSGNNTHKD